MATQKQRAAAKQNVKKAARSSSKPTVLNSTGTDC